MRDLCSITNLLYNSEKKKGTHNYKLVGFKLNRTLYHGGQSIDGRLALAPCGVHSHLTYNTNVRTYIRTYMHTYIDEKWDLKKSYQKPFGLISCWRSIPKSQRQLLGTRTPELVPPMWLHEEAAALFMYVRFMSCSLIPLQGLLLLQSNTTAF